MKRIYTPPTPFTKREVVILISILIFCLVMTILVPFPFNVPFGLVGWAIIVALLGNLLL